LSSNVLFFIDILCGYLRHRPDLALDPGCCPWLGAFLVTTSCLYLQSPLLISLAVYLLALSGYSLLMLRYSSWAGFSWIATLAFAAASFAYNSLANSFCLWFVFSATGISIKTFIEFGSVHASAGFADGSVPAGIS
jgi:hypothetical protein